MTTPKVFLSLSYVDSDFVAKVHARLPRLAYFYEQSFENGEAILEAMERTASDAALFVLFASKTALESPAVKFEMNIAKVQHLLSKGQHRILIFPTDPAVTHLDFPKWMQSYWIKQAGYSANDIARYIRTVLLEPDVGMAAAAPKVVGRGKTDDKLDRLTADFLGRTHRSPSIYILAGFNGVGRKTFAAHYMRRALAASPQLVYGPTLTLPVHADLADLYRAIRVEAAPEIDRQKLAEDLTAFSKADERAQIAEVRRYVEHFTNLGQAITFASSVGFFEDRGDPKTWAAAFFASIPEKGQIFIITTRQFAQSFVDQMGNAVQIHVDALDEGDLRALMIFTSEKLGVIDFKVSDAMVKAIGGHADVAKAAVRLALQKGSQILERNPKELYDIQKQILGESFELAAADKAEREILNILSWVPELGGDYLEQVIRAKGDVSQEEFIGAVERLILTCLITVQGYTYRISPPIRLLFRRLHVTPPALLKSLADVLSAEWKKSEAQGEFRNDLFDAFVFMHALEGKTLAPELRGLLTPGMLEAIVRQTYAKGKDEDNSDELERVIAWGGIAEDMNMSNATREEILSNVTRAEIRLGRYKEAARGIEKMGAKGYKSALFLKGYMLRREGRYAEAAPALEDAVREHKNNRSAIHELAICYKKLSRPDKMQELLNAHRDLVADSALLTDFQIGIDLARNDIASAESGIRRLRQMPDDNGKADQRQAQLLMRQGKFDGAKSLLEKLLGENAPGRFRLRTLRAIAAARVKDFRTARDDLTYAQTVKGRSAQAKRLEAIIFAEEGRLGDAETILHAITDKTPEDWYLVARIFDLKAEAVSTGMGERDGLHDKAKEIRAKFKLHGEHDYEE